MLTSIPGPHANTLGYIVELDAHSSETTTRLDFHFNPDTVTLSQHTGSANQGPWAAAGSRNRQQASSGGSGGSGGSSGVQPGGQARTGGSASSISITLGKLYFDSGFQGSVLAEIKQLFKWFLPSSNGPQTTATSKPPDLSLYIGGLKWITGKLTGSMSVACQIFTPDGQPTRALVTGLMIQGNELTPASQNPTSGGLASYSAVTIGAGDSLESIAFKTYGHARLWRQLAIVNGIDDPLRVRPGMTVMLPTLNEIVKVG